MEEQKALAAKPEERLESEERDLHIVQVGEFLSGEGPQRIKQEHVEDLQQCWKSPWQEFLEKYPEQGRRNITLPQSEPMEESKKFQDPLERVANASQMPRGPCRTPSPPGVSGDAQETYGDLNVCVKVKEEIMDEEGADLEMQHQNFHVQEDWSPRKVLLQILCMLTWDQPQLNTMVFNSRVNLYRIIL